MPLADPYATVYAKVVALLKAETTLYDPAATDRTKVFPKNFVDYTDADRGRTPQQPENSRDGDYPALYVDEESEQDSGIMGTTRTFGQCAWRQRGSLAFSIYLIGGDTRLPLVSALRWAAKVALLKGGAQLGLLSSGVHDWTWRSQTAITANLPIGTIDATGGALRRACKITVTVNFEWDGKSLTT